LEPANYRKAIGHNGKYYYRKACTLCVAEADRIRYATLPPDKKEAHRKYHREKARIYAQERGEHKRELARARYARLTPEQQAKRRAVAAAYLGAKRKAKKCGVVEFVNPDQLLALLEAANGRCFYCANFHGANLTFDHVVPIASGGSHSIDNFVVACGLCNATKNNRTPEQWLGADWRARRNLSICNIQPYNYTLEVPQ
jgi:5-methylcytosine-specific restriction endonuclease McrA